MEIKKRIVKAKETFNRKKRLFYHSIHLEMERDEWRPMCVVEVKHKLWEGEIRVGLKSQILQDSWNTDIEKNKENRTGW